MRSMAPGGMARAKPRGRSHTAAAVLVTVSYLMRPAGAFRALFGCHRIAAAHTAATRMSSRPPPAEWADAMAKQALAGLQLEYPHKVDHLWLARDGALSSPASLHPVFYGNYDWHSAVHSHWCLVRLLRRFPEHIEADAIAAALRDSITTEGCNREAAYFSREGANTFERPYGWGWLMKLAEECALASKESEDSTNPCAPYHTIFAEMSRNLLPLTQVVREGWLGYLPRLSFPVRSGVHSNTAFALALSFDYAQTARDSELKDAIALCSRRLFGQDVDYSPAFEPSGAADLDDQSWRCVCSPACACSTNMFTHVQGGGRILSVPTVSDRSDARICHLDGLLLSKAWALRSCSGVLGRAGVGTNLTDAWCASADEHYAAASWMASDYVGSHWLHSFALLCLDHTERTV